MSALRKYLKDPGFYLLLLLMVAGFVAVDAQRAPQYQLTAKIYVTAVHVYQRKCSPSMNGFVKCRFQPTCSHYSEEAVQRYGIWKGLRLTASRLSHCRSSTALGTLDPVP